MATKAALFKDEASFEALLQNRNPKVAKAIGRKVEGFDATTWNKEVFHIIAQVLQAKFASPPMAKILMETAPCILAEMSSQDSI